MSGPHDRDDVARRDVAAARPGRILHTGTRPGMRCADASVPRSLIPEERVDRIVVTEERRTAADAGIVGQALRVAGSRAS